MEKLQDIVATRPLETQVSLASGGLAEIDSLMPYLASLKSMKTLELQRNRLHSLPSNMASLGSLETLDISRNPFSSTKTYLPGLASLPHLKNLSVTMNSDEDEEAVIMSLPRLCVLNGVSLTADGDPRPNAVDPTPAGTASTGTAKQRTVTSGEPFTLQSSLTQQDLDDATRTFEALRLWKESQGSAGAATLKNKFDAHLKHVIADYKFRTENIDDVHALHAQVIKAKEALYDLTFSEAIDSVGPIYPDLAKTLESIRQTHYSMVQSVPGLMNAIIHEYESERAELKHAVARSDKETNDLLEAAELLEQETHQHIEEKRAMTERYERERVALVEELARIKQENDVLRRRSGTPAAHSPGSPSVGNTTAASAGAGANTTMASAAPQTPKSTAASRHGPASASKNPAHVRALSLRQLKDVVNDIYDSKLRFDKKCAEAHLPRETMEQHLYTYLNQKYGLKTLIVEWASAIIHGVKKYANTDNDVAVFGAILRNEIDEEFRFVQKQIKESVQELLRFYLRGKFPLKTEAEITVMLKKRMAGELQEDEWVDIVRYMYNQEDSTVIIGRLKDVIRQRQQAQAQTATTPRQRLPRDHPSKKPSNKVPYLDFLRTLLDFQLQGHERFLYRFNRVFANIDNDKNGIVNESKFRQIVSAIAPTKTEHDITDLLNSVDPYNNQQITFSECVTFLSTDIVALMKQGQD